MDLLACCITTVYSLSFWHMNVPSADNVKKKQIQLIEQMSFYLFHHHGSDFFLLNNITFEHARAVDKMMLQANRIYILIIKVNKLFSFFT